eukprot:111762-Amphidinium_carterae.1
MTYFVVSSNLFAGRLPDSLFLTTALTHVLLQHNRFAGTLPTAIRRVSLAVMLGFSQNYFEGPLPSRMDAQGVIIGYNRLAGTLPERLFDCQDPLEKIIVASEVLHVTGSSIVIGEWQFVLHEGAIPRSASRMTAKQIILSLGH